MTNKNIREKFLNKNIITVNIPISKEEYDFIQKYNININKLSNVVVKPIISKSTIYNSLKDEEKINSKYKDIFNGLMYYRKITNKIILKQIDDEINKANTKKELDYILNLFRPYWNKELSKELMDKINTKLEILNRNKVIEKDNNKDNENIKDILKNIESMLETLINDKK